MQRFAQLLDLPDCVDHRTVAIFCCESSYIIKLSPGYTFELLLGADCLNVENL